MIEPGARHGRRGSLQHHGAPAMQEVDDKGIGVA